MASDVQICNLALQHLGASPRVVSLSPPDGSVETGYCVNSYSVARQAMLEEGEWTFGRKRSQLAPLETNPSQTWAYAYALPADYLRAVRVLQRYSTDKAALFATEYGETPLPPPEWQGADYEIEGGVILTNEPDAVLIYKADVIDTRNYTPTFVLALSYHLAGLLAGPVIKGLQGAQVGQKMLEIARGMAMQSSTLSARASQLTMNHRPSWDAAR